MKKKSASQSAPARRSLSTRRSLARRPVGEGGFLNLRVLMGLFIVLAGVFLALAGFGIAQAQQKSHIITNSKDPLVPNGFDCSKIHELGIDRQENFRAGAIIKACGPPAHPSPLTAALPLPASPRPTVKAPSTTRWATRCFCTTNQPPLGLPSG